MPEGPEYRLFLGKIFLRSELFLSRTQMTGEYEIIVDEKTQV